MPILLSPPNSKEPSAKRQAFLSYRSPDGENLLPPFPYTD
jgi:hypothetical protein